MATAKLPFLLLLTLSLLAAVAAAAEDAIAGETPLAKEADSQLRAELEQLKSKISALESSISDRTRELEGKDGRIAQLEKSLLEKTASIVSLQGEVELSQKKGAVDAEKIIGKVQQRAEELEKEVEDNKKEIEAQNRVREALESRASEAEKKVQELILKVENVHGAWLPPWLANFIYHFQDLAVIHWNEHGKPAVNLFLEKASEKSAQVQELAKPHLETVKTKWIPVAKDQWVTFTTHVGPYVDTVSTKTVEFYTICRSSITPHVIKVQEFTYPHLQKVSESAKPHIDKISSFTKPHVENVCAVLKPYTEHLAHAYGEFLKSATLYHQQAEALIQEKIKKYELTDSLATKELVWFMASALLALPVFVLYRIFCVMFCKKSRKPTLSANAKNTSRKPKRRYTDK